MTRINTNVPSLVAQNRLNQSNGDLQQALTRLSTGLRINSGKDDPAGLIASEALRSEITSINKAISNTQRANQIITTADSALGQVSSLLSDVRGLVVEAANSGALSDDEIAANQLQIDSSLEAINRIAQTTTFQGRKLLDGSLSFQTKAGTNFGTVADLQIDQANLGTTGSVDIDVKISAAAEQATVDVENIPAAGTPGTAATGDLTFTQTTAAVAASLDFTLGGEDFTATAGTEGVGGNDFSINVVASGGSGTAPAISHSGDDITITLASDSTATADAIALAFNTYATTNTLDIGLTTTGGTTDVGAATLASANLANGADEVVETAVLNITADAVGTASNITSIVYNETDGVATPTATFAGGTLTINVEDSDSVALADVLSAIENGTDFTAAIAGGASLTGSFDPATTTGVGGNLVAGAAATTGGLTQDAVFELQGTTGSEVFNVSAGTGIDDLISQINLVSDATGITASKDGTTLTLTSKAYGSDAIVDLRVIEEATGGTLTAEVGAGIRDTGADIQAKVNGVDASGRGNKLTVNTATLDLQLTVDDGSSTDLGFAINGGGALFQLGADVVGNQQARIGINSVNTARLGGASGKLFQLGSSGDAALAVDPNKAAKIVTEAIDQVTSLRGRLGAFQATTLESNMVSLNETVANLQEAESSIRDADFAQESAKLTRAQILVQSGTNVLSLANQNPQNVLSLLR